MGDKHHWEMVAGTLARWHALSVHASGQDAAAVSGDKFPIAGKLGQQQDPSSLRQSPPCGLAQNRACMQTPLPPRFFSSPLVTTSHWRDSHCILWVIVLEQSAFFSYMTINCLSIFIGIHCR